MKQSDARIFLQTNGNIQIQSLGRPAFQIKPKVRTFAEAMEPIISFKKKKRAKAPVDSNPKAVS